VIVIETGAGTAIETTTEAGTLSVGMLAIVIVTAKGNAIGTMIVEAQVSPGGAPAPRQGVDLSRQDGIIATTDAASAAASAEVEAAADAVVEVGVNQGDALQRKQARSLPTTRKL